METIYGIDGEKLLNRIENKIVYAVRDNVKPNYYLVFADVPIVALNSAIHDAFDLPWTIPDAKDKDIDGYKSYKLAFDITELFYVDSAEKIAEKDAYNDIDHGHGISNLEENLKYENLYRKIINCVDSNSTDYAGLCFIDFDEDEQKYTIKRFDIYSGHLKDMLEDASNLYERDYRLAYAKAVLKKSKQVILSYLTENERHLLEIELTESKKEEK